MTAEVAAVLPIIVGRAIDVAFRLGLAFGAAMEAVAVCPAVLLFTLFTSPSTCVSAYVCACTCASTSAAVSSSSVVVSTCLVLVVVDVVVVVHLGLEVRDGRHK
jgi:hypothetical protein